jgi:hypothetical protein
LIIELLLERGPMSKDDGLNLNWTMLSSAWH